MRIYLGLLCAAIAVAGCDKPATKIGTACKSNGDCNVAGQVCAGGICTHACLGINNQCPIGYDCYAVGTSTMLTCNKASYKVDAKGAPVLFGKDCSTDDNVCANTGDPNPAPQCRKAEDPRNLGKPLTADPNAYCTGTCNADSDCPFFTTCSTDYDGVKKCKLRGQCAPCKYDDACNSGSLSSKNYACVPTADGKDSYCTKVCGSDKDCPGAAQALPYLSCLPGQDLNGVVGSFCFHKFGACVGAGEICDPCRTKDDCAKTGTNCVTNDQTGEQFCTKRCTSDAVCAGPNNATCDNTDPMGNDYMVCTGDSSAHQNPAMLSCWGFR